MEKLNEEEVQAIEEKNGLVLHKEEKIKKLNLEIEELNVHFSNILKQTLEKMKDKIEISKWENFTSASS